MHIIPPEEVVRVAWFLDGDLVFFDLPDFGPLPEFFFASPSVFPTFSLAGFDFSPLCCLESGVPVTSPLFLLLTPEDVPALA